MHQCDVSFLDLISLRQQYNCMEHKGRNDKNRGWKLLLDAPKLIGIIGRGRVPNY
jgi:hypothetical protein